MVLIREMFFFLTTHPRASKDSNLQPRDNTDPQLYLLLQKQAILKASQIHSNIFMIKRSYQAKRNVNQADQRRFLVIQANDKKKISRYSFSFQFLRLQTIYIMQQDESYQLRRKNEDQTSSNHQKKKRKRTKIYDYWTNHQNQVYATCLRNMGVESKRVPITKKTRIFKKISIVLGTRTAIQVKTHHQKMILKFRTIQGIVEHFASHGSQESDSCSGILKQPLTLSHQPSTDQDVEEILRFGDIGLQQSYIINEICDEGPQNLAFSQDPWSSIDFMLKINQIVL